MGLRFGQAAVAVVSCGFALVLYQHKRTNRGKDLSKMNYSFQSAQKASTSITHGDEKYAASVSRFTGEHQTSHEYYKRKRGIYEQILLHSVNAPLDDRLATKKELADICIELHDVDEASKILSECVAEMRATGKAGSLGPIYESQGELFLQQAMFPDAGASFIRAAELCLSEFGIGNEMHITMLNNGASALVASSDCALRNVGVSIASRALEIANHSKILISPHIVDNLRKISSSTSAPRCDASSDNCCHAIAPDASHRTHSGHHC